MKFRDIIGLLKEDYFYVHIGEKVEHSIHIDLAENPYGLLKYMGYEVVEIWREEYGMGILLLEQ